jgi:DNA-binding transcriptional LysR family regulator
VVDSTLSDPANPIVGAMRRLLTQSPAIEITISIMSSAVMEAALLDDRIHIGLLPRRSSFREQITYQPLYSETSSLCCGKTHPLFTQVRIECDELQHHRYISPSHIENARLNEVLGNSATQVSPSAIARNVEGTAMLLLTGQFLGFLPTHVIHPLEASGAIRTIRPDHFTVHTPLDLIFKSRKEMNPVLERFLQELKVPSR